MLFPSPLGLQVLGQRKRSSAVAILDVNGANESAAEMLKLAEDGRREWKELQAAEAAKLREDALSKDQQAAAGPMEEPRDELGDDGGKGGLMSDTLGQPPPNMGTKLNASASAFVPSWVK